MAGRPACLSWAVVVGAVVAPHLEAQTTELISLSETFEQANRSCREPSLSADGNIVVYETKASNIVVDDTNNVYDVFAFDRQTSRVVRVSVNSQGQ